MNEMLIFGMERAYLHAPDVLAGMLAVWLVLAMIAGMLFGTGWGGRFEPPHNLLVVLLWLGVFRFLRLGLPAAEHKR